MENKKEEREEIIVIEKATEKKPISIWIPAEDRDMYTLLRDYGVNITEHVRRVMCDEIRLRHHQAFKNGILTGND